MRVLTDHLSALLGVGGIATILAHRAFQKIARFVVIAAIAAAVVAATHGLQ
jgi:hypothetical protein